MRGSVDKTEGQVSVHLSCLSLPLVMEGTQEVTIESGEVGSVAPGILVHLHTYIHHNPVAYIGDL